MKSRQANRVQSNRTTMRRWLAQAISFTRCQIKQRRLLCEPLERRYALHGMGWFADSFQPMEHYESSDAYNNSVSTQYALVFSLQLADESIAGESEESVADDLLAENDCDRPRRFGGLRGEGEGPGVNFTRPIVRLELRPESGHFIRPIESIGVRPEPKIDRTTRPVEADNSPKPTGQSVAPISSGSVGSQPPTGPEVRFGPQDILVALLGGANGPRPEIGSSPTSADNLTPRGSTSNPVRSEVSPALTSNISAFTAVTTQANSLSKINPSGSSSANTSSTSVESNDGQINTSSQWQRSSRSATSESTSLADTETEGLLRQLRSVIERLASEHRTERTDVVSELRLMSSLSSGQSGEFYSSGRKPVVIEDGMLELSAANDKLAPSMQVTADSMTLSYAVQHRSQLLASLELNREFELAGQSVQAMQNVVDPTYRIQSAQVAAETVAQRSEQVSTSASSSTEPTSSDGSLWQRSLLPLSFLALGGLLLRKNRTVHKLKWLIHKGNIGS